MGIQDNDNTNKNKGKRDCQTKDTENRYPDCLVAQTHRINALRQAIADISGYFYHSKHVWITLTICRYLANRLRKFYVSPKDMAGCGWLVYQTISALYLQVRIYKKDLLDRLTLGMEKGGFLLICGSLAAYDDRDRIRHDFIIAHAIFNLSHCAGLTLEDVRLERQRQLAKMVEDSLTKESCESEFGANIW
jgi:hypothetical protein